MAHYTFKEMIHYFAEKLKSEPSEEAFDDESIELQLDENRVILSQASKPGSFKITLELGFFTGPIEAANLKELTSSNFMGVNTGGCSLYFDEAGTTLSLSTVTTPGTTPQENWEWLHRIYSIAQQWTQHLTKWEGFTPLATFPMEKKHDIPAWTAIRV